MKTPALSGVNRPDRRPHDSSTGEIDRSAIGESASPTVSCLERGASFDEVISQLFNEYAENLRRILGCETLIL